MLYFVSNLKNGAIVPACRQAGSLVRKHMPYVYFIKSSKDSSVYVGSTENLKKRIQEHNRGKVFSTKGRRPYSLIYFEEYSSISESRKREKELKESRSKKENILKEINTGAIV